MDIGGFNPRTRSSTCRASTGPAKKQVVVDKAKADGPSRRVELCAVR